MNFTTKLLLLMHYVKIILGQQVALFGTINSFVHIIMYSYYFLTIVNPSYKKAWWKKYLTVIQLVMYSKYNFSVTVANNNGTYFNKWS